jgi:hypothetical protein
MSFKQKLREEVKEIGIAALFFGCWIGALLLLKWLILDQYRITFHGWSMAVVGALVLSKVVLILKNVSLGTWVRARPAWVEVALRTILYTLGVAVVLLLEKGFEGRHAYGGFGPALQQVIGQTDFYHVLANTLCLSGALLVYNMLSVVQQYLEEGSVIRIFLSPLPDKPQNEPERRK